jgi:hypothetical protein
MFLLHQTHFSPKLTRVSTAKLSPERRNFAIEMHVSFFTEADARFDSKVINRHSHDRPAVQTRARFKRNTFSVRETIKWSIKISFSQFDAFYFY